jgi:hypothetical protein
MLPDEPSGASQNDPLILQAGNAEIEQQRLLEARDAEVVDRLREIRSAKPCTRLHLHDDPIEAHEIGSEEHRKYLVFVLNSEWHFKRRRYWASLEFTLEGGAVDGLKESRSKDSMHFHRSANDLIRFMVAT